ncbi:HAD-superfamily phosphatase, subfamily IIIC:FkbH [Micromonospora qiuiae]|uniref:HAD-superfamily phosphatase, subfamily IIIC:FkbH n=1 Tax=Micromonospora qiuiae TaxID=502268 RepID=A0ABQ4JGB5_9ACTN|nr:HAD-IIIC family phosphatase [Micromonospora qiuiae]GIJ29522.1 HAD-superfamily phosphatase, subfamily IIIC:FkbH [Micromonospora qiuiae]
MPTTEPPSAQGEAEDRLRHLHRSGVLAQGYPSLPSLLEALPESRLSWAGQLIGRVDPDDVLKQHPDTPVLTVGITGHGTLAELVPSLTAEFARHGLLMRRSIGDFGQYVNDLSTPDSHLYARGSQLVLCLLDPMVVFDEVPVPWSVEDVEKALEEKLRLIGWLVGRFAEHRQATLVLNTLPLPRRFSAQLVDHRSRARLGVAWRSANVALLRLADQHANLVVLDLDPLLAEGVAADDIRLSMYAKAHLAPALLARYAREIGHLARHLLGRTKKVLALDLDGTLWGGVLGEDGPEGVEVAGGYRGDAFQAFQRAAKQLAAQGVLLAAVSKNDVEPVRAMLSNHPDLTLREGDFVRVTANWEPKPGNLRETAEALNLGVDSFVFVDDSPYECGMVRRELPEVAVLAVNDDPALHLERLLRDGWFDVRDVTVDDRARPARYRDEVARGDFLRDFDSIEDYLRELGVRVTLAPAASAEIGRISQITLRTNQFNLTTTRLQPAEVRTYAEDPARRVFAIRSSDRFGDNGLVGAMFTRREADDVQIDNFLLSCRVFGRGIEQACLAALLRQARDGGANAVIGSYRPTAKNAGVKDLYSRYGFQRVAGPEGDTAWFRHDLTVLPAVPEYVLLTETPEDGAL